MEQQINDNIEKQPQIVAMGMSQEIFQGPLPHPKIFEQYEKVLPGLGDRITTMAEKQAQNRRTIEKLYAFSDFISSFLGYIFAFLIVLVGIIAGVYLIMKDKPVSGFVTILIPLGTLVGAFLIQNKKNRQSSNYR